MKRYSFQRVLAIAIIIVPLCVALSPASALAETPAWGRYIVVFRPGVDPAKGLQDLVGRYGLLKEQVYSYAISAASVLAPSTVVETLSVDPDIAWIEPDRASGPHVRRDSQDGYPCRPVGPDGAARRAPHRRRRCLPEARRLGQGH